MGRRTSKRLSSKASTPPPKKAKEEPKPVRKAGGCQPPKGRKSKTTDANEAYYTVEYIVDKRVYAVSNKIEYQVKWQGYDAKQNTWEPLEHFENCPEALQQFEEKLAAKVRKPIRRNSNHSFTVYIDNSTSSSEEVVGNARKRRRVSMHTQTGRQPGDAQMPSTNECGTLQVVRRKLYFGDDQDFGKS